MPSSEALVPAPQYRVGDRWIYQAEDGFRVKHRWLETQEVIGTSPSGIAVRVTRDGADVHDVRIDELAAPGQVNAGVVCDDALRRFDVPLRRLDFPLETGRTWNQWVGDVDTLAGTHRAINYYARVAGRDAVSTSAGTFDALRLNVLVRLDDAQFWRHATVCRATLWYAPAAGNVVRESIDGEYLLPGDSGSVRTTHSALELREYHAGRERE